MVARVLLLGVLLAVLAVTVTLSAAGAGPQGNAKVGKSLFLRAGVFCGSCHTLKEAATTGRDGPNLDKVKESYAGIVDSITKGGAASKRWPTGMPGYGGKSKALSAKLIRDIAAFVYVSTHR